MAELPRSASIRTMNGRYAVQKMVSKINFPSVVGWQLLLDRFSVERGSQWKV